MNQQSWDHSGFHASEQVTHGSPNLPESTNAASKSRPIRNRPRRPEMQRYVPRAMRVHAQNEAASSENEDAVITQTADDQNKGGLIPAETNSSEGREGKSPGAARKRREKSAKHRRRKEGASRDQENAAKDCKSQGKSKPEEMNKAVGCCSCSEGSSIPVDGEDLDMAEAEQKQKAVNAVRLELNDGDLSMDGTSIVVPLNNTDEVKDCDASNAEPTLVESLAPQILSDNTLSSNGNLSCDQDSIKALCVEGTCENSPEKTPSSHSDAASSGEAVDRTLEASQDTCALMDSHAVLTSGIAEASYDAQPVFPSQGPSELSVQRLDSPPAESSAPSKNEHNMEPKFDSPSAAMEFENGNNCKGQSQHGTGIAPVDLAEEEDSWDARFNDDGDAINPDIMEELTSAIGNVNVRKTQYDYYNYQPKEPELDYGEYGHLIEIYDFSPDLVTRDLLVVFKDFSNKGFDIKWVDDTHAIGIFASNIAAHSALSLKHPLLKVRPISEATRQTKVKAKRCTEFLLPYKARPATNASVARNLVAGALGLTSAIDVNKSREDKKKLQEARAEKRAKKKQKHDAWEGSIRGCAMDDV